MFDYGLGASLSSFTPHIFNDELTEALRPSRVNTFELNAAMFFYDYDGACRRNFKIMLQETGKQVISYHIPFGGLDELSTMDENVRLKAMSRFRAQLATVDEFQCRYIVLHASCEVRYLAPTERAARIARLQHSLLELEPELKSRSVQLAVEFLPRACLGNTLQEMQFIINDLDDQTFGVCFDVNHIMNQYPQIPAIVRGLDKRLFTLHLSDYDGIDERHWLPTRGVIDWAAFIAALRDIDYRGPFNYEIKAQEGTFAGQIATLEANYDYLKGLLK